MLTHPIPRGAAGPMGWWYVFGSASLTLLLDPDPHRHRPGPGVRAGRRQGVREPAVPQLRAAARLVPAGAALLRRVGHGGAWSLVAHDPGLPARGVQVPARADLGRWASSCSCARWACSSPARSCAGTRTPTGAWRSAARWPGGCRCSGRGWSPAPGRPGHRRRHPEPVLRPARLRHPRPAAALPGHPPLAGAQGGDQRAAGPRASRSIRRPTTRSTRRS